MYREWGQKLPVEGSQSEQAATAQEDHSGPGVVPCGKTVAERDYYNANSQFLLWWLDIRSCPTFPLKYLRYFPWLLVPADLPDTRPVPVPSLNKVPVFQHLVQQEVQLCRHASVGWATYYRAISTEKPCRGRLTAMQVK